MAVAEHCPGCRRPSRTCELCSSLPTAIDNLWIFRMLTRYSPPPGCVGSRRLPLGMGACCSTRRRASFQPRGVEPGLLTAAGGSDGAADGAAAGSDAAVPTASAAAEMAAAQDCVPGCVFCEVAQGKRPANVVMRVSTACGKDTLVHCQPSRVLRCATAATAAHGRRPSLSGDVASGS